jgi:hypothetical protein
MTDFDFRYAIRKATMGDARTWKRPEEELNRVNQDIERIFALNRVEKPKQSFFSQFKP